MTFITKLPENSIKIGPSNWYTPVFDNEDNWVGIKEWHMYKGELCGGFAAFNIKSEIFSQFARKWNVIQYDPLTLAPSLLCKTCGNHGFISHGKWVPA